MNETIWEKMAAVYDLGEWSRPPQAVAGGLKHQLYHAQTTQGEYAVKVLNPRLLREPGRIECYRQSEQIAQAAARAGLPAVTALPGPDGPVQTIGPATVMVFPWIVGKTLPPHPASSDAARQVGALLGRLHTLSPVVNGLEPSGPTHFLSDHWADLAGQARQEGVVWANEMGDALPELADWSMAAHQARKALGDDWTATHRDMDQKNILWSNPKTPWLLDWEDAGAMNPVLEVMGTALNWAGQAAGQPDAQTFAAFLEGYQSAAPLDREALRHAAVAVLDKWLVWLDFNLRRSLYAAQTPPDEQVTACGAAEHALATLRALAADTPRRLQWCDAVTASSPDRPPASRPICPP